MQIIQKRNSTFDKVISTQKQAGDTQYRLLTYSVAVPVQEGLLLYNALTCEMILLEGDEAINPSSLPYLRDNWFAVPESFDDRKLVIQYRQIHDLLKPAPAGVNHYTILTTTDCNAHCFYCYELGRSRIHMSEATANKAADFIIKNYHNLPDDKKHTTTITWFGGEPLYNLKAIDIIIDRLKAAEVPYTTKMVSNGYLFDEEVVNKAKESWKLKRVQITLDGTEEIYNRSKAFMYKEGSAFQRVMRNIGLLLDAGIRVVVRMNIDTHNADDLKDLARQLSETFKDKKGLSCYSHGLFEFGAGKQSRKRSLEARKRIYDKERELRDLLIELKLRNPKRHLPHDIPFNHCMADNSISNMIAPTGDIGLCEHYSDSDFFSHLDTPDQKDKAKIREFADRCEDIDICADCPYYPHCIRLKMCPEGSICFKEIKEQRIDDFKVAMREKYRLWQTKQNEPVTEDDNPDNCQDVEADNLENC